MELCPSMDLGERCGRRPGDGGLRPGGSDRRVVEITLGRVSFPPRCRNYAHRRGLCARRLSMSILKKAVAAVLPLLAGCFVGYEESPRHYDASSQVEATVAVTPDVEEVDYVVYREYFGCTEAEIG